MDYKERNALVAATVRLMNGVPSLDVRHPVSSAEVMRRTLEAGYILHPDVTVDRAMLDELDKVAGLTASQANASFHKSWGKVRDAPYFQLLIEQIMHYYSTYEVWGEGMVPEGLTYLPLERLDLPENVLSSTNDQLPVLVLVPLTTAEIITGVQALAASKEALGATTIADIQTIVEAMGLASEGLLAQTNNREIASYLRTTLGIAPDDPEDYLRWLITELTGETLLINSPKVRVLIKATEVEPKDVDGLLTQAPSDNEMGAIFLRHKALFLTIKQVAGEVGRNRINRWRKAAKRTHEPIEPPYLRQVTALIKAGQLDVARLSRNLASQPLSRKVGLMQALLYRLSGPPSHTVYAVRSGRSWVAPFAWDPAWNDVASEALEIVQTAIAEDLSRSVAGEVFYIPQHIEYPVPNSGKQYAGRFPNGTRLTVEGGLLVGIQWTNLADSRVDLDLSIMSADLRMGWDAEWRTQERDILFSGDMTDAPPPHGSSELYYFRSQVATAWLVVVNIFNDVGDSPVDCTIFVAQDDPQLIDRNHMVAPDRIIAKTTLSLTERQTVIGLVTAGEAQRTNNVHLMQVVERAIRSSRRDERSKHVRQHFVARWTQATVQLTNILSEAGAEVVRAKPEGEFIDLSPEKLTPDSIAGLLGQ